MLGAKTERLTRVWTDGLVGCATLQSTGDSGHTIQFPEGAAPAFVDYYDIEDNSEGCGTYGIVFPGTYRPSGTPCVVKVVDKEAAGASYQQDLARRMSALLQMTQKHCHPNVVHYLDMLESARFYFVIMEKLEGPDLLDWFGSEFPLSERVCKDVAHQVLSALQHLHTVVGICHRDVKLDNFRFRQQGSDLVLLDVDTAHCLNSEKCQHVAGTLGYLAPEVVRSMQEKQPAPADSHVDIWACGVVLYALLTGEPPLPSNDNFALGTTRGSAFLVGRALNAKQLSGTSAHARDLLKGMLDPEQQTRFSAACALNHLWFQEGSPLSRPNVKLPGGASKPVVADIAGKTDVFSVAKQHLMLKSESWHW